MVVLMSVIVVVDVDFTVEREEDIRLVAVASMRKA